MVSVATPAEPPGRLPEHVDARPEILDRVDIRASIGQQRHPDPVVGEHDGTVAAVEQLLRGSSRAQRGPPATKVDGTARQHPGEAPLHEVFEVPDHRLGKRPVHARIPGANAVERRR